MRRSGRLFIVLGVGLALVAVLLVGLVLLSGDGDDGETTDADPDAEEPREITVVVAARDVPAHTVLRQDDVEEQIVESDKVPGDVLRSTVEAVGFAYSIDLVAGQPLAESERELPGLANQIADGHRAVTLPVDAVNLIGGQLRGDDRVDIVFSARVSLLRVNPTYPVELPDNLQLDDITGDTIDLDEDGQEDVELPGIVIPERGQEPPGPTYPYPGEPGSRFWVTDVTEGDPVGKLIIQNIRVLRVVSPGDTVSGDAGDGQSFVILELEPAAAEMVEYLQGVGEYRLILRNPEDEAVVETPGVTMNQLVDSWGLLVPRTVRLPEAGTE